MMLMVVVVMVKQQQKGGCEDEKTLKKKSLWKNLIFFVFKLFFNLKSLSWGLVVISLSTP